MTAMVSIYEAKTQLSKLIAEVEKRGQPITICRNHKPVAALVPRRAVADPLRQDPRLRGARFVGDPCAPVSAGDWPEDAR
jgi:prevent-host-death family protein